MIHKYIIIIIDVLSSEMMIMQKKSEKNVFKFSFRSKNEMILSTGGRCLAL